MTIPSSSPESPRLQLEARTTALVLIDLQNAIVSRQLAPHSADQVLQHAASLAEAVRSHGGTVIYVHVKMDEILTLPADSPATRDPNAPPLPANASDIAPQAGFRPGDLLVTKRQWGAFHATDLDQQLRRRRIDTILLGGIATNFGVESTARAAFDHGYKIVFVEDAMSGMSADAHNFSTRNIFTRMGRVRSTAEVLQALQAVPA